MRKSIKILATFLAVFILGIGGYFGYKFAIKSGGKVYEIEITNEDVKELSGKKYFGFSISDYVRAINEYNSLSSWPAIKPSQIHAITELTKYGLEVVAYTPERRLGIVDENTIKKFMNMYGYSKGSGYDVFVSYAGKAEFVEHILFKRIRDGKLEAYMTIVNRLAESRRQPPAFKD